MAKVANLKSSIQSKIQQDVTSQQQKTASSTQATQAGSTITPEVTSTPKVTQTAKAMPSITRPDISSIVPTQTTTQPTTTVNAKDLLWSKTQVTPLKKAATPDLLSTKTEEKEIRKTALPLNLVRAADKQWWAAKEAVDKTLLEQFSDWFKETPEKVTNKVWNFFKWPVMSFWTSAERMINDTEYWVAWLADVIETSLWWKWWFKKAFQEQQWWYWDAYGKETDLKAAKLYEEDTQAQNVSRSVSDYLWTVTWNKEMSNMIWTVVWNVTASLKDPEQIASVAWYMAPALVMQWATWWWFLANTAIWLPSQSTNVYKDFSEDKELSSQFTDNQLFGISTWLWTVLSMVETFWDALWDMPWAKAMSRSIRNMFTKSLKKPIAEWLTKEITDVVDRNLIKDIKQPVLNALKKWYLWSIWEWLEEVTQDTLQTEWARALGSKREWMSLEQMLTTYFTAKWMGLFISWPWAALNIKNNSDLKKQYNEFSKTVDKVSPWINEDTKMAFFSAMITSQQNDANLSEKKVKEYEEQTTKLYEERSMLEQRLKQADNDEVRAKINGMIEQTDNKIKEIDKKINQWNNTRDEINKYIEERNNQKEIEEIYESANKQSYAAEWWENLSEQTMRDVEYHLPSTWKDYESFAEALKQPQNDILKKLSISDLMEIEKWATRMRASATPELVKSLDFVRTAVQKELEERYNKDKKPEETKPAETIEEPSTFKDAQDYIDKMLDYEEKKAWRKLTDAERYRLTSKYSRNFLRKNIEWDFSKHMPWLKWVNLKQVEWELTDEMLTDIADMLALVSDTFWVDFNKLITDKNLSLNVAQNVWTYLNSYGTIGIMLPKNTKDKLRELLISKWFSPVLAEVRWEDIATAWVAISLKDWLQKAWETMAHELWHFIDFATSLEEWLPLRLVKDSSGTHIDYTSIIAKQRWWRTFNLFDVKKWDDYYNDPSEILARYAEQYFAYIHDNESFKELAYTKEWYWTPEEFEKLLPKFESLVRGRIWGKLLDKWNEFYYDVMNRIRDNKFARISEEFDRWWLFKTDVKQRIEFMKEEYAFIMSHINEMTWTLKEEMETYVQLSNLQSNYEMAKAKGEEYLKMLNTTPEQQWAIDNITTTVLPPEPVPWNPNPTPPNNPTIIRQWLPYFWWSNIEEGIGDIIKWWKWEKLWESYMKEEDIIKIRNRKNKIKGFFKECEQAFKDVFTPAISRIYNISPRVAWRLVTMETQKDINIYRYRQKAKWFVETLWWLKWNNALEVKMALLDYWALASEQGENIEQYKKDEVAKLKEVLLRNWFKEKDINDMFSVLDDIWQQYKDAWLSVTLTDMYFPRVVKDYEWLIDYMNRVSWNDIKVNKLSLMMKIRNIQLDEKLTDEEKEAKIRRAISIEFKQPWTTSQHWKERKMWKLSDWWEWIFAYYESPIESIDHYITTMVNAIQRQLFLWWMKEDADITEWDILNQSTAESVSTIIWKLVEQWKVSEDDIEELQKSILAVLNKKPSPKSVTAIKDITYISTITNFLLAINQLDDLWMVILRDRSWLKHIVKTIAWRAWIKYDDLWLEDAYEMFREELWITNWLFKKSLFNSFDRLGKTSFINTAWESIVRQAKNEKTRKYLYTRLQSMYWTESADRMMEKIDSNNYKGSNGQIDIEILRDLLYQLWSTQPIYTSAMPVIYLNHPWVRLSYTLSSFTLKRMDWLVQWFKEVNAKHWKVAAWAWVMSVSFFLAMFWAAIWDIWDLLKWKKEDTFLWNLINKWIDEALAAWWSDMLDSWLKIWDLSEYDLKTLDRQWMQWLIGSKISPFIFDLGKDVIEAVWKHDANEITDLSKYIPIFWKLAYYWFWDDLESVTKPEKDEWDFSGEEEWDFSWEEEWDFSWEEEWDFS